MGYPQDLVGTLLPGGSRRQRTEPATVITMGTDDRFCFIFNMPDHSCQILRTFEGPFLLGLHRGGPGTVVSWIFRFPTWQSRALFHVDLFNGHAAAKRIITEFMAGRADARQAYHMILADRGIVTATRTLSVYPTPLKELRLAIAQQQQTPLSRSEARGVLQRYGEQVSVEEDLKQCLIWTASSADSQKST